MNEIVGVYREELISIVFKRGDGTKENPVRLVKQYRTLENNEIVFEIDFFGFKEKLTEQQNQMLIQNQ